MTMSWYYLMTKPGCEYTVVATRSNMSTFKRYGFSPIFGFGGKINEVDFVNMKGVWHTDILNKKKTEARLWRVALGIEAQYAAEVVEQKAAAKARAMERKKTAIVVRAGVVVSKDQFDYLKCPFCGHRYCVHSCENNVYVNSKTSQIHDTTVFGLYMFCHGGVSRDVRDKVYDGKKSFYLVRPSHAAKINKYTGKYIIMYGDVTLRN